MRHELDARFAGQLAGMDPEDVCRRSLCEFDPDAERFVVEFWGDGELKPQILKKVTEHKLENFVIFKGFTNNIQEIYATLDFLVTS